MEGERKEGQRREKKERWVGRGGGRGGRGRGIGKHIPPTLKLRSVPG